MLFGTVQEALAKWTKSADRRGEAPTWAHFVSLLTVAVAGCSWSCVLW